jgi:hypothetical protein
MEAARHEGVELDPAVFEAEALATVSGFTGDKPGRAA